MKINQLLSNKKNTILIYILYIIVLFIIMRNNFNNNYSYNESTIIEYAEVEQIVDSIQILTDWDMMWIAISKVESGINDSAKNPNSTAIGRYQLLKIITDEANRILGYNEFTYDDRYNPDRAFAMLEVIHSYHNPKKNIDKAIRIHSIGFAYDSLSIMDYKVFSGKVYREMDKIKKEMNYE